MTDVLMQSLQQTLADLDAANVACAIGFAMVKRNEPLAAFAESASRLGFSETVANDYAKHGKVLLADPTNAGAIAALRKLGLTHVFATTNGADA